MRNKKTGEIVSILSQSWGSYGSKVCYAGRDAVSHEMDETKFLVEFEQIDVNLEYLIPYVLEASKIDNDIRRLVHALARKCTPEYYNVGDIVYVVNLDEGIDTAFGNYIKYSDARNGYYFYHGWQDRLTFKITAIKDLTNYESGMYEIELSSTKTCDDQGPIVKVQFFKNRLFCKDASYYLKRYDREI